MANDKKKFRQQQFNQQKENKMSDQEIVKQEDQTQLPQTELPNAEGDSQSLEQKEPDQSEVSVTTAPQNEQKFVQDVISTGPAAVTVSDKQEDPVAQPEVVVKEEPAAAVEVKQTVSTTVVTSVSETLTDFVKFINKVKAEGTKGQKDVVATLEAFVEATKPGLPIKPADFITRQQSLWAVFQNALEKETPEEFRRQWYIILAFFETYKKAALGGRHVFRFAESWNRDPDQLLAFQCLVNIIHLTSNPDEREAGLKEVDLARSLEKEFSEAARSRLVQFYNQ